jgi:hypothetical protein
MEDEHPNGDMPSAKEGKPSFFFNLGNHPKRSSTKSPEWQFGRFGKN